MPLRSTVAAFFAFLSVYAWSEDGLGPVTGAWEKVYVDEFDLSTQASITAMAWERPHALAEMEVESLSIAYVQTGIEYEELPDQFNVFFTLVPDFPKGPNESYGSFTIGWRGNEGIHKLRMNCWNLRPLVQCSGNLGIGRAGLAKSDALSALRNLSTAKLVRLSEIPWRSHAPQETFDDEGFLSFLRTAAKDVLIFDSMSAPEFAKLAEEFPARNSRR